MTDPATGETGNSSRPAEAAELLRLTRVDAADNLADALARAGFRRCNNALPDGNGLAWRGLLTFTVAADDGQTVQRSTVVDVVVPDAYPFRSPKVHPGSRKWAEEVTGRGFGEAYYEPNQGWHREFDLSMCLFDDADAATLPWADGTALLRKASAWLAADAAGWVDDAPALDLERYLPSADEQRLLLYGPLNYPDGAMLRCQGRPNNLLRVSGRAVPRKSGRRSGTRRWGPDALYVAAASELSRPIRDWNDLLEAVGPDRAKKIDQAHRAGIQRILLTYTRRGVPAALALQLEPGSNGTVQLRSLRSAPDDQATRILRAGPTAPALSSRSVAIIGVGAVGSVVADLLHRSGVGQLCLIDADHVLPGNTTRHLVGESAIGLPKTRAVADHLSAARPQLGHVTTQVDGLIDMTTAVHLLVDYDVVVDATADSTATALLTAAAAAGAGQLLSVAVLADGYAVRVDRTPPPQGQPPLQPPQLPAAEHMTYEAGCGSPLSTTPPAAVWEAAAMAARHTIGLLTAPDVVPPGEERVLSFGRDPS